MARRSAAERAAWGLASCLCGGVVLGLLSGKNPRLTQLSVGAWEHHLLACVFAEHPALKRMMQETQPEQVPLDTEYLGT